VIGKVQRGDRVSGLLHYLYGPGKANEHLNPHLVAAWDDPAGLEPTLAASGRRDFRHLTELLDQPLTAAGVTDRTRTIWHCSLRTAPGRRRGVPGRQRSQSGEGHSSTDTQTGHALPPDCLAPSVRAYGVQSRAGGPVPPDRRRGRPSTNSTRGTIGPTGGGPAGAACT
jgi:hypothetical protein